jgi:hypothetical protein
MQNLLKKEEYIKTVRRPYAPFFVSLMFRGFVSEDNFKPYLKGPVVYKQMVFSDSYYYYSKTELARSSRETYRSWQDPEMLAKAKQLLVKSEQNLLAATDKNLNTFKLAYEAYMPALLLVWTVEKPVNDKMRELLLKQLPWEQANDLMDRLNIPEQNNYYKQEEYDLVMTDNLAEHAKQYEWLNSRYGEISPYTEAEARAKQTKIDKEKFLQHWQAEKQKVRQAIQQAKELLGPVNSHYVDLMQFIIFYRTQRTDTMNRAGYMFIPELKKLAASKGVSYKQLIHAMVHEIETELPAKEILNERIKDNAMVLYNGQIRCETGQASEEIKNYLKEDLESTKEFKGAVAYKGKVQGQAKLIFSRDDYDKIKPDDILVTSMTIISREMKKPCIIGTKIATQILNDGDLIEVDAERGVVRKL